MYKPICAICRVQMTIDKNGVPFVEKKWCSDHSEPYKLYFADRYECPVCHALVLGAFGSPIGEWDKHFNSLVLEAYSNPDTVIEILKEERPK